MPSEQQIKAEIERIVRGMYSIWTIGVTDDPVRRRREHDSPTTWHQWDAYTEATARRIEQHFLAKGMNGAPGGRGDADYVYIF